MQETQETQIQSLGLEDPLEEGMATHSNILAWRTSHGPQGGKESDSTESSWHRRTCAVTSLCHKPQWFLETCKYKPSQPSVSNHLYPGSHTPFQVYPVLCPYFPLCLPTSKPFIQASPGTPLHLQQPASPELPSFSLVIS